MNFGGSMIVYYQAMLEAIQCLLKHWSDVCGNLPTVLFYLRACPFVLVKGVKASAECPASCALTCFGRSLLSWVVTSWKEWGRKLMRRNKYFFWEVRGSVLFETASNIAAWLEYQGKEKRKEEGTGNVQWKSCIILPWHFLFLVRFNSRSEGVFSFPCLVENRSIKDVSLRKAVAWGNFGKLPVVSFLLSLCSVREASRHRTATALCAVSTPELCRVPVHFNQVWVMLSYIWGEEWPKYITPQDSGVLLWSLCQCRAVATPACCLWSSMTHIV